MSWISRPCRRFWYGVSMKGGPTASNVSSKSNPASFGPSVTTTSCNGRRMSIRSGPTSSSCDCGRSAREARSTRCSPLRAMLAKPSTTFMFGCSRMPTTTYQSAANVAQK